MESQFPPAGAATAPQRRPRRSAAAALLYAVVEAIPNAILLVDRRGRIRRANSRAARLFGYEPGELDGLMIEALVPERLRRSHRRSRQQFMQAPGTREMGLRRELYGRRKDGSEVPIEVGLDALTGRRGMPVLASVIDISERRRAQQQAADATALAQSIIESAPFAIVAVDRQGRVLEISPAAERLLGCSSEALIGERWPRIDFGRGDGEHRLSYDAGARPASEHEYAALGERLQDGGTVEGEWILQRPDGSEVPVHLVVSALRDERNRLRGFIGVAYDISERKRSEARIRHIAEHDALTDLPNRAALSARMELALAQARRSGSCVGVLLVDLDHFKRVNDSLGHQLGDKLLVAVAGRLRACVRSKDTVARMGGDEFVVLLPNIPHRRRLERIAAKIVERLSAPLHIEQHRIEVTPSIGLCCFPQDGDSPAALLMNADTAMYAAKEAGRRRFQSFTQAMADAASERWLLEGAMREALGAGEFRICYQPQLDLRDGRILGVEALLRWQQPGKGPVSPERFIAVAEQSGLITVLGDWVLKTACAEIGELRGRLPQPFRLAINLSPRQLLQPDLLECARRCLALSRAAADTLELEITETVLLHEDMAEAVAQLRALGVRIAIDDFGTGYSSLSHITRFPVDRLKIDRSFVCDLTGDASRAAVTAAIIAMAHQLGIEALAEGVENQAQRQVLIAQGCHEGQGFLYSEAVPATELIATIGKLQLQNR